MSLITKLDNPLTPEYQQFKRAIKRDNFIWGHTGADYTDGSNPAYFSHPFILRPDDGSHYPRSICDHTKDVKRIVEHILAHNRIELQLIYRMNLNMTYAQDGNQQTPIHVDHEFKHQNLLIYLSTHKEGDGGQLIVEDEEYYPTEDDVVMFDGLPHSTILPKKGFRTALVTTFLSK